MVRWNIRVSVQTFEFQSKFETLPHLSVTWQSLPKAIPESHAVSPSCLSEIGCLSISDLLEIWFVQLWCVSVTVENPTGGKIWSHEIPFMLQVCLFKFFSNPFLEFCFSTLAFFPVILLLIRFVQPCSWEFEINLAFQHIALKPDILSKNWFSELLAGLFSLVMPVLHESDFLNIQN